MNMENIGESTRQQKVARQIQKDISELFLKECAELVRGVIVSVTTVRVSPDLEYARIYLSIFPFERHQEIMARISIDKPSVHDIDELIAAGIAAMEHDPFSPTLLNILVYAYGASGDKVRELAYSNHLKGILKCIEQSGDGLKEKSPMHIIMFSHGLDYIASKGIQYKKSTIISRTVEFVPFVTPQNKAKGYYFDYSRVYWNKPENYTFKRERTWQFNNLKPREYK